MKRILIAILLCSLLLTACQSASIGIIGGADGPTAIFVGGKDEIRVNGQFGEQSEKKSVRMFNADGDLYYDLGIISNKTPRCGTSDGELKKCCKENEIPFKSGEANFDVEGYQNATSITKEVNIDGNWHIFKKYDTYDRTLDDLKYCYYIKGHLNNAAVDSEIIVLSENENVTFNDVYEPMLSSQFTYKEDIGKTLHNPILNDKWGINLSYDNLTAKGLTLQIEQFGGNASGALQMGVDYTLETVADSEWQPVKTKTGEPLVFHSLAYKIKENDITQMEINWENSYGTLKPGYYRLKKEIMDFRASGDYEEDIYELYFDIE